MQKKILEYGCFEKLPSELVMPSETAQQQRLFLRTPSSAKAAVAEGIVPGGGFTLLRAIDALNKAETNYEGDFKAAIRMLKKALEMPTRQIAENSAIDGGVAVAEMRRGQGNVGLDAATGQYVDLLQAGIIDPTKVVRLVLENAVSVAGTLLLTEAMMTDLPEPKTPTSHLGLGDE